MKYAFNCWFRRPAEIGGIGSRVAAWLHRFGEENVTLQPRADALPATTENILAILARQQHRDSAQVTFAIRTQQRAVRGRLDIVAPWYADQAPCGIYLDFSLGEDFRKSPFTSARQIREHLVTCAVAVRGSRAQVEAQDLEDPEHDRRMAIFQRVGNTIVPVAIEWINAFSDDTVRALGWTDMSPLESVDGVRWGREGEYWWITLTDRPFSYKSGVGVEQQREVHRLLRLPELHTRFAR